MSMHAMMCRYNHSAVRIIEFFRDLKESGKNPEPEELLDKITSLRYEEMLE
jgi:hypothetical protein